MEKQYKPLEDWQEVAHYVGRFKNNVSRWSELLVKMQYLNTKYLPAPEVEIMISDLKGVQEEEAKALKKFLEYREAIKSCND